MSEKYGQDQPWQLTHEPNVEPSYEDLTDCIKELEANLSKSEALLVKAVEALEKVQAFVRDLAPYADQGHTLVPELREACEILIELKGEDRG
jgi:hypothetical protein